MDFSSYIIVENMSFFIDKLMKENLWSYEFTLQAIDEYKKFILLCTKHQSDPSPVIDRVWHMHILFTKDYIKMCETINEGKYINHNPTPNNDTINNTTKTNYTITKENYVKYFGHEPPANIWGFWYRNSHYAYIDLTENIVFEKNDLRGIFKFIFKKIADKF